MNKYIELKHNMNKYIELKLKQNRWVCLFRWADSPGRTSLSSDNTLLFFFLAFFGKAYLWVKVLQTKKKRGIYKQECVCIECV